MAAYLNNSDVDAMAATMLNVDAVLAASDDKKTAAAEQASDEIDAVRWQGAKFDPSQDREFPRVPGGYSMPAIQNYSFPQIAVPEVWDWDATTNTAVVPLFVKKAFIRQMNWLLDPTTLAERKKLAQVRNGLVMTKTGDLQEQYLPGSGDTGNYAWSLLCPDAQGFLSRYLLAGGEII